MLLRRLTFRQSSSNAASSSGFNVQTFKEDFTGNCKSVSYYLSNIEKHLHPKIINRKKPKAKHVRALLNLKQLLVSFVRDLECNSMGLWFNELVCDQQRGHEVLLKLLSNLITSPVRAGKKGVSRDGSEQELCAKCLVLISNNRLGLNCLASYEHGYQILLQGLGYGRYGTVKHICSILLLYCKLGDSNHSKLISHMDCFKKKEGNESKFSVITKLLSERVEDFTFTTSILNLLTGVVHSSPSLNIRTFYQQEVELEIAVESILEGVPKDAVSLHKAMREWRDNCIDIPVITRKLEAAQARSGLLNEECRALREKLGEKEEQTRKLAKKQQQLIGSHDTTHNELSDMRCRMEEMSKELIREKVKVQRLEATLSSSQPNVNITSFVNNNNNSTSSGRHSSSRRSRGEGKHRGQSAGSEEVVHRRRSSARSRRHHDTDNAVAHAQVVGDLRRLSNRSSSGSDCYLENKQVPSRGPSDRNRASGHSAATISSKTGQNNATMSAKFPEAPQPADLPPLPRKLSTLSRRRLSGIKPSAPPAPPAPALPPAPPANTSAPRKPPRLDYPPVDEIPPAPPLPSAPPSVHSNVPPAPPLPPSLPTTSSDQSTLSADKEGSCIVRGGPTRTSDVKISVKTSYKTSAKLETPDKAPPATASSSSTAPKPPAPTKTPAPKPPAPAAPPTAASKAPTPVAPPATAPKAPLPPSAPRAPGAPSAPRAPGAPRAPRPPGAPAAPRPPGAPGAPPPSATKMTLSKQPQVKLPMLHWNAVRRNNGTYWDNVNMSEMLDKLDLSQFENQFKLKTKPTLSNVAKIIKRKVECLSLLDTNRARNAMIIQRRVALQPSDVARCVEQTDLGDLPLWAVELLHGCIPSQEESDKLIMNSDKLTEFGEAELFCFHLSKVNRYDRKLGIMQFIGTFDEQYARLSNQVKAVKEASNSISVSERLKKVLEIILALGNFMNSQRKGLAVGFKIQSLCKIAETHSGDYKFTLLHYIVKTIHTSMPELIGFTMEFEHLENAQKVLLKELVSEIQEMKKNLDTVLDERNKQRDNFVLFSFYKRAQRKVKCLGEETRQMLQSYETVCKGFGENPKAIEPHEFFKYFSDFFFQFDNIERTLYQSDEKKKKAAPLSKEISRNLIQEALVQHASMY